MRQPTVKTVSVVEIAFRPHGWSPSAPCVDAPSMTVPYGFGRVGEVRGRGHGQLSATDVAAHSAGARTVASRTASGTCGRRAGIPTDYAPGSKPQRTAAKGLPECRQEACVRMHRQRSSLSRRTSAGPRQKTQLRWWWQICLLRGAGYFYLDIRRCSEGNLRGLLHTSETSDNRPDEEEAADACGESRCDCSPSGRRQVVESIASADSAKFLPQRGFLSSKSEAVRIVKAFD